MGEFATANIQRYCSIEGRETSKTVEFAGLNSFFFAYPSGNHWTDFSRRLTTEMTSHGVKVQRWQDTIANDLLFAKVCELIHGNDYLLAEITEPNPNVLLEVGYALAVGRLPVLLTDTNRPGWNRTVLKTLESCRYETRDDIHQYIAGLLQNRNVPETPDRRLPFLENTGIFDAEVLPNTAYHLKPKISTDWLRRVDRALTKSKFQRKGTDPSDFTYDQFYEQARGIQQSTIIIASLVGNQQRDHQEHNANVALLVGFAIGIGKNVLVLHQQPATPILDLGSVTQQFDTESEVESIVRQWLDKQAQLVADESAEARRLAVVQRRVDKIRRAHLGHPDALQDSNLLKYFVETPEYQNAIDGQRSIFVGRRGTGKSANFKAIKDHLSKSNGVIPIEIAPDDFELERLASFLSSSYESANMKMTFQSTWNYILVTEMLKALESESDIFYGSSVNQRSINRLRQYYSEYHAAMEPDFGTRVIDALTKQMNPQENRGIEMQETEVKSLRDYNITRHLKNVAEENDLTFFMVADDLDKHWKSDTEQSVELLLGLIAESDRLRRFFGGRLKVAMFLREDIFDTLARRDEDLTKRDYVRMTWTQANLMHLVSTRLAVVIGETNHDDAETWFAMFPHSVYGQPSDAYIISRTLPRPRDVLAFCQSAIEQARANGHTEVSEQDVLDGETKFARDFPLAVASEFQGVYPNLADLLLEFASVPERMPWQEFQRFADSAAAKNDKTVARWFENGTYETRDITEVLFSIGMIGLSKTRNQNVHYRNGRSFSEIWQLTTPQPTVHIHQAFVAPLEAEPVEQSPADAT